MRTARLVIVGSTLGLVTWLALAVSVAVALLPDPRGLLTLRALQAVVLPGLAAFTSHPFGAILVVLASVAVLWSFAGRFAGPS